MVSVGAYERDNFGDLLYLELMRAHAGEGLAIQFAAPTKSESSEPFGRTVPAAAPLLAQGDYDAIWTVGGEVVSASPEYAYRKAFGEAEFANLMRLPRSERTVKLRAATEGALYDSPYIRDCCTSR